MELPSDNKRSTSLKDVVLPVWKRLWAFLLVVVLAVGTTTGFTLAQTPMYEASAKILVRSQANEAEVQGNLAGDVAGLQTLTQTMAEAAASRPMAEDVIQRLDLSMSPSTLLANLTASQVSATPFISISYRNPDPETARLIATTFAEVFAEKSSEVNPSASSVSATVWERPPVPAKPVSPNLLLNVLAALAVGLMLGVGLAYLLEYLDDSWRSPEELERVTGVRTFGVIPVFKAPKGAKVPK